MSGLLVKSTIIMRENLEELNTRGLADKVPVLLGGAALTRNYVERDLREVYEGRVFYGKDAFEGLHTMDTLIKGTKDGTIDPAFGREAGGRKLPPRKSQQPDEQVDIPERSDVAIDVPVFSPPFVGARVAKGISLDEIAAYINETALFRNQWQFRPQSGEPDADFKTRVRAVLRSQLDVAKQEGVVGSRGRVGLLRRQQRRRRPHRVERRHAHAGMVAFPLPAPTQGAVPLHQRFLPAAVVGDLDYAGFHIVTMGPIASAREKELFAANKYQDYCSCTALSVEMAEALAELWHKRIREEWGLRRRGRPVTGGLVQAAVPRVAVFVGLSRVPRARGADEGRGTLGDRTHRRDAHRGVTSRARAVDLGDHRPPPRSQVLRRLSRSGVQDGAGDEVGAERGEDREVQQSRRAITAE
jgi:5-methyltetrahydrofolate--homocysteine methyltransferase